jgi:hypothetical protein
MDNQNILVPPLQTVKLFFMAKWSFQYLDVLVIFFWNAKEKKGRREVRRSINQNE